jgi:ribonuclease PH
MARNDGRAFDGLRPIRILRKYTSNAPGSVLIEFGKTRVLCTATIRHDVPPWMSGKGSGWVTAEYGMLPGSTGDRKNRERAGKVDGRTQEIQRLIGRSMRAVVDRELMGERTIWLDCDVIEADGGTRTASITGAYVALMDAFRSLEKDGIRFPVFPVVDSISAVSVGLVRGELLLDLCYIEDSRADVDLNVVMTGKGQIVEVQGTAEKTAFSRKQLNDMIDLAETGMTRLRGFQEEALKVEG